MSGCLIDLDNGHVRGMLSQENGGTGGKNNMTATDDPTPNDDISANYKIGSLWANVAANRAWVCTRTDNPAIWQKITPQTESWILKDKKGVGEDGGTFTAGAWRTRELNTMEGNPDISIISLENNQIIIQPGRYTVRAEVPAEGVGGHKARLFNVTMDTVIAAGSNQRAPGDAVTSSTIYASFTVDISSILEIQHRCTSSVANKGFGSALSFDDGFEIYTCVEIARNII